MRPSKTLAVLLLCGLPLIMGAQCLNPGPQMFGQTVAWQRHTVNTTASVRPTVVQVFDFDADGRLDILAGYEGADPPPPAVFIFFQDANDTWTQVLAGVGAQFASCAVLDANDIDNDGRLDIVAACKGGLIHLRNPGNPRDPAGWTNTVIAGSSDSPTDQWADVALADIDGVNGRDIVAANQTKGWLTWFVNPGFATSGAGWTRVQIDATTRAGSVALAINDVDGDGRLDVFSSAKDESAARIAWYKNPALPATQAWTKYTIGNMPASTRIAIGDLNVDGLNDLVVHSGPGKKVGWYVHPTTLAPATAWKGYLIAEFTIPNQSPPTPIDVKVAQVDAGSQPDVIVAATTPGRLRWFIAVGNQLNPWGENNLDDLTEDPARIAVADINNDGRPDIIAPLRAATSTGDSIAWFENPM